MSIFQKSSFGFQNILLDFEGLDNFEWTGVAISSNSRFLYVTKYEKIYQYDLLAMDIDASRVLVASLDATSPTGEITTFYQARLGPDGRIYIAGTNNSKHLHVIYNPDCKGLDCNVEQYVIKLPAINRFTMPNFPHFRKDYPTHPCDSVSLVTGSLQQKPGFRISPNPTFGEIRIECKGKVLNDLRFQLYDMDGKAKLSIPISMNGEIAKINLEVPSGIYIYKIVGSEKVLLCDKIVILK
ncbi:MAG: T9SS type A sorting domain-containing protein [Saprospiraceae bacterium]|nr:T9SS type A sorting domain-containing protein [Saprospiraceae bacterium]MCF8252762.1 T9SS type A sorting domain-containing protein [Saprospiraceae bacterium]MCF8283134.1 T9SS type A sorting domain-containing protein [Bacteroidales bacterium]MCF8314302.1 T9SS type A sorting domain-containing protein [Saprospiraceae bacterium]MCF8443189.1 T9SS type A sorting domain-containing protein [Saprospiraceae bacterium]